MLAGYHEVVYSQGTKDAFLRRQANPRPNQPSTQWRVSSTMFTHFRNDVDVSPMPELAHLYTPEEARKYPRMTAFEILMQELSATGMTFDQNATNSE